MSELRQATKDRVELCLLAIEAQMLRDQIEFVPGSQARKGCIEGTGYNPPTHKPRQPHRQGDSSGRCRETLLPRAAQSDDPAPSLKQVLREESLVAMLHWYSAQWRHQSLLKERLARDLQTWRAIAISALSVLALIVIGRLL